MNWWLKLRKRRALDRDLEEEIAFHRALRQSDPQAPPFGNPTLIKETVRDMWTFGRIETLFQDARYALRGLWRDQGFTLTALTLLALAIGANTTIFTVVKRVLIDPLPYPDAHRLLWIWQVERAGSTWSATALDYLDWTEQARTFEGIAGFNWRGMTLNDEGEAEAFQGVGVSANFFRVIGVQPALGRDFRPEESERGQERVVVLSHSFWQRKFGGDPSILGRSVRLNGEPFEVIGVMPPDFAFPEKRALAWAPIVFKGGDLDWINRSQHNLRTFGRLMTSSSIATAGAEMDTIAAQQERAYPATNRNVGTRLQPLKETVVQGDARSLVLLLYGAVTVLLLIAFSNLAGLLVARTAARRNEFATRAALGASRWRLISQMLVETGLLSVLGGAAGLALAWTLLALLKTRAAESLPRTDEIALDPAVLGFSIALTLLTGLLFGVAPAAALSRMVEAARGIAARGLRQRMRSALVVVQLALAVMLLAGAGLFLRSFVNLTRVDKGYDSEGVVSMTLILGNTEFPSSEKLIEFARQLDERLTTVPGLQASGFSTALPLSRGGWRNPITIADRPLPPGDQLLVAPIRCVSPRYFDAMRTPLKLGRPLTDRDHGSAPLVLLVDETFVRAYLPAGESPIGQRVRIGSANSKAPWRTIVGVLGGWRQFGLDQPAEPMLVVPYAQLGAFASRVGRAVTVVARTSAPGLAVNSVKEQVAALAPGMPVSFVQMLSERVDETLAPRRFQTTLMAGFAGLALLLAAVGLYGVIAFAAAQRTQEIGVRMALGAKPAQIVSLVIRDGARLGALGVTLGVGASLALSKFLEGMLFGVSARDGITLSAVAAVLLAITLLASYLPARRAASIDPLRALRME